MPGTPKRRARKIAQQAEERAAVKGISIDAAMLEIEAETQTRVNTKVGAAKTYNGNELPPGERARLKLEEARDNIRKAQAEWLIGAPDDIARAYENREREAGKYTQEIAAKLVYLTRAGIPVKDTQFGAGSARQCGIDPTTVWDWIHAHPEFGRMMREARDQSSEILEDEVRAMLPTALTRPDLLDSLQFIAGRLEWLAKARNPDRYGNKRNDAAHQSVTFNIMAGRPAERDVTPAAEKLKAAERPTVLGISIPSGAIDSKGE